MSKWEKFREKLLSGQSDANIAFSDLTGYLTRLGFIERISGSHHVFDREGIAEIITLQPSPSGKAKSYQVKQVRAVLENNQL